MQSSGFHSFVRTGIGRAIGVLAALLARWQLDRGRNCRSIFLQQRNFRPGTKHVVEK